MQNQKLIAQKDQKLQTCHQLSHVNMLTTTKMLILSRYEVTNPSHLLVLCVNIGTLTQKKL